jgi:NADH:ubiquinone oxidoreductase subunit 3 (subunit A)
MDFQLSSYYPVLIFLIVVLGLVATIMLLAHLIGPRRRTKVKDMVYESGMDPIGSARQKFDVKFYLIAILFLVFDVELLFLYPWAVSAYVERGGERVVPAAFSEPIFWEMLVFIATLLIAFLYAWRRGVFKWR